MKDVIGSILPLAIAVTISPVPIIAEILLLFTKKPVANAGSYLAGFIVGVAGVLAILVAIAGTINLSAGSGPSKGASILQLALGALLLAATAAFVLAASLGIVGACARICAARRARHREDGAPEVGAA